MTTGGLRAERLARLGRLLDAHAALGGHSLRHRIDRLLDRDSPFLELAPLSPGPVTGIGLVEGTACVVTAGPAPQTPTTKAARATALAATYGLPLLAVAGDDDDEPAETARLRQGVRYGPRHPGERRADDDGEPTLDPPAVGDPDGVLDATGVADVLQHVLDGSRFDRWTGTVPTGLVAGWGAIGGLAVAVVGRDGEGTGPGGPPPPPAPFADQVRAARVPLVRLLVVGPDAEWAMTDGDGREAFAFSWPGADPGDDGGDGAVDPRDTRVVMAIARWCVGRP